MNKVIKRCEGCVNEKKCVDEAMAKIIQPLLDKAQLDVEIIFTMVFVKRLAYCIKHWKMKQKPMR